MKNRLLVLVLLAALPIAAEESRSALELEHARLARLNDGLLKESDRALLGILDGLEGTVETRRRALEEKVRNWALDINDPTTKDLQQGMQEGLEIAGRNGLDVQRLTRIYELTKTVIRRADFVVATGQSRPPGPFDSVDSDRVSSSFLWANRELHGISDEEHRHVEYRVGLYRRATVAYIRALTSAGAPHQKGCQPRTGTTVTIGGQKIPTVQCPDPVVDGLRQYVNAVRSIQSADADALVAEAQRLGAEQQLAVDLASAIPAVGDALDVYNLFAAEDLAGNCITPAERAFNAVLVALPFVGPKVGPPILEAAMKRWPWLAEFVESIYQFLDSVIRYHEWYQGATTREVAADLAEQLAKRWETSVPNLRTLSDWLHRALDLAPPAEAQKAEARRILRETIQNASRGAQSVDRLSTAYKQWYKRTLEESEALLDQNLRRMQGTRRAVIEASHMVPEHVEAIEAMLKDEARQGKKTILVYRAVNPEATERLAASAMTKWMDVKGTSADWGVHAAFIPVDQKFSKLGNPAEAIDLKAIGKYNKEVQDYLAGIPSADLPKFKMNLEVDGFPVMTIKDKKTGREITAYFDKSSGRYLDKGKSPIDPATIDVSDSRPLEVLSAPHPETGLPVPLTADYDVLAFGFQGAPDMPAFNPKTGFVTEAQEEMLDKTNRAVRNAGYRGGNISHHGPENQYPYSPGALKKDPKVLSIDPELGPLQIPRCDKACMQRWCETSRMCAPAIPICDKPPVRPCLPADPDRLLKDYFHNRRLKGYDLSPNEAWNWGHYNATGGWTLQGFLDVPVSPAFSEFVYGVSTAGASARRAFLSGVNWALSCPDGRDQ